MPISLERLQTAAFQKREALAKSLTEARAIGLKTAFLCHSHLDRDLAIGLAPAACGWLEHLYRLARCQHAFNA
jgi:hypothetical protein